MIDGSLDLEVDRGKGDQGRGAARDGLGTDGRPRGSIALAGRCKARGRIWIGSILGTAAPSQTSSNLRQLSQRGMDPLLSRAGDGRRRNSRRARCSRGGCHGGIVGEGDLHDAPGLEQRAVAKLQDSSGWEKELPVDVGDVGGQGLSRKDFSYPSEVHS